MLKRLPPAAALLAGAVSLAAPADAKVSITRAQQICEAAAVVLRPPPKSVRIDRDELLTTSEKITVILNVRTAEDAMVKVSCTVDRETSMATLLPTNLAPATASLTPGP